MGPFHEGAVGHSPAEHVRRPKIDPDSATLGLDRMEPAGFIARAAAAGVMDHALACLLDPIGLRVAEACSIDIDDLSSEPGHRIVTVVGKGSKLAVIPLPPRAARAVDVAAGERRSGPLLLTRAGNRMNRQAATRIVRRLAKTAGVTKHISPHSLRHSFITTRFRSGADVVLVAEIAGHRHLDTTRRYSLPSQADKDAALEAVLVET